MYYIVYILIFGLAIFDKSTMPINHRKMLFNFIYSIITLMAMFRYGQGQDYFNYEAIYKSVASVDGFGDLELFLLTDFGFCVITQIAIFFNISFHAYSCILSFIAMMLFYKFLKEQCNYSFMSLLIFYSVIYFIYPTSALRQALSMGIFFAYMYPLLYKKNSIKYFMLGFLATSIHLSSFIYFFMPLIKKISNSKKQLKIIYFCSFLFLIFGANLFNLINIPFITERFLAYTEFSSGNQLLAILVRVIITIPLLFIPSEYLKDNKLMVSRNMMIWGFFIYSITSFSEVGSSRMWGFFLGFECIVLSKISLANIKVSFKKQIQLYFIMVSCVLWLKDINAIIGQGHYKNCSMLSYPYISVFEGDQILSYYRKDKGFVIEEASY